MGLGPLLFLDPQCLLGLTGPSLPASTSRRHLPSLMALLGTTCTQSSLPIHEASA
ncbi:hypothetical protein ACLOJK_017631 [Asimina triloba]